MVPFDAFYRLCCTTANQNGYENRHGDHMTELEVHGWILASGREVWQALFHIPRSHKPIINKRSNFLRGQASLGSKRKSEMGPAAISPNRG